MNFKNTKWRIQNGSQILLNCIENQLERNSKFSKFDNGSVISTSAVARVNGDPGQRFRFWSPLPPPPKNSIND